MEKTFSKDRGRLFTKFFLLSNQFQLVVISFLLEKMDYPLASKVTLNIRKKKLNNFSYASFVNEMY